MATACVLLADGFEEIEAITIIDVLRRAGVEVAAVGVSETTVTGAHGIRLSADLTLGEGDTRHWDLVALPGGLPGAHALRDDPDAQALIRRQHEAGRWVAAICAAPIALGRAGILHGKRATCYPGFEAELAGATLSDERVVRDQNVITSQGPGTALRFAVVLASLLAGSDRARELERKMLV